MIRHTGCETITDRVERPYKNSRKDKTIANIVVVGASAPSEAWKILKSNVDDDRSERAKKKANKNIEEIRYGQCEIYEEYIARAKSLALILKYHGIKVPEQEKSRRVLIGLPPAYAPKKWKRNFALKADLR